jgi:hypothetical protein
MRFQLRQTGWGTKGGGLIPAGTVIDDADPWGAEVIATNGSFPPLNAQPLDQSTYNLMATRYPKWSIITMPGVDGIIR